MVHSAPIKITKQSSKTWKEKADPEKAVRSLEEMNISEEERQVFLSGLKETETERVEVDGED